MASEPTAEMVFLPALSAEDSAELRQISVVRRFERGAALFHEGQQSDRVLVLLSGKVKLTCTSDQGRETLLGVRGEGDLLGELSAIDGEPRSATAEALEQVEALAIRTELFKSFLESHPKVAFVILRMLSSRLRDADQKRVEFAAMDSMGRVAGRITELVERFGQAVDGGVRIDLPLSQEELAGWTGCSREAVAKALQAMRDLGWLETGRRTMTVLDTDALRERAR